MKNNLAYQHAVMVEAQTVGQIVSAQPCLCVAEDCPVDTVLAMMSHMGVKVAAVIGKDNIFQGLLNRSSLLGNVTMNTDFAHDRSELSSRLRAGDAMISTPAFLPSEIDSKAALTLMTQYGYKTMPVLGDGGKFMGLADVNALNASDNTATTMMSYLASKSRHLSVAAH